MSEGEIVCENTYHVVISGGTVPVNVPSGTNYLSVYKIGGEPGSFYGSVTLTVT